MKRYALKPLTWLFCLFVGIWTPSIINAQTDQSTDTTNMANAVLYYVNQHRTALGLSQLHMNDKITEAAEKHSKKMADKIIPLGHDGFDNRVGNLLKELSPANAGAENVADGNLNAKEVVDLWLHSPGHRKNIEGNYNLTGIGIAKSQDGNLYFTQIFINQRHKT